MIGEAYAREEETEEFVRKERRFFIVFRRLRKNKHALFGLFFVIFIIILGIFAPLVAPYDYDEIDMSQAFSRPSLQHLCGTDKLGRDIFSRLLYGIRYSLGLAFAAPMVYTVFGIIFGSLAGYFGGRTDNLILRLMDILQAIPGLLMAIIISATLGGGFLNTVIALGIGGLPMTTRLLRASILSVRELEFLEAARSINCPTWRQIVRHVLPNSFSPLIVNYTMSVGVTIMQAASLSYIGLGIQPPLPEWGAMISGARQYIRQYPYMILYPGIILAVTVIALNMFGDGLRDALDPKMKS